MTDLVRTRDTIRATVLGSEDYRVVLRPARRALGWSCTCPLGEEGTFCKHAVAAGLAWLARGGKGGDDLAGLRAHLESESKESLIELLAEQAASDPELRARLEAAALRRGPPQDIKAMKATVNDAFAVRGFAGHHHMRALFARADGVVHLLRELLRNKRTADAAELAGHALRRGIAAYERTDDSGGGFGEVLHRLAALHLETCRAAKPEPEAFGKDLLELQLLDQWGFFKLEDYAPLLGKKGLAKRDYQSGHSSDKQHILISMASRHADKIFSGQEQVELRRRPMRVTPGAEGAQRLRQSLSLEALRKAAKRFQPPQFFIRLTSDHPVLEAVTARE